MTFVWHSHFVWTVCDVDLYHWAQGDGGYYDGGGGNCPCCCLDDNHGESVGEDGCDGPGDWMEMKGARRRCIGGVAFWHCWLVAV